MNSFIYIVKKHCISLILKHFDVEYVCVCVYEITDVNVTWYYNK